MTPLTRRDCLRLAAATPVLAALPASRAAAAVKPADLKAVVDKAFAFLKSKQGDDGSFVPKMAGPGLTALTVAAALRAGMPASDPVAAKGLGFLEKSVQPDGGVYSRGLANYTTCLAIVAFKEGNSGGKYDTVIANASKFVKGLQDDSPASDVKHGGVGYDGKGRPDMSNTHFWVEALLASGVPKDDPSIKEALKFIGRSQNLPGKEFNDQPFAAKASADDKGGFVYNPTGPGGKGKGPTPPPPADAPLRSAGSMTYAGLKSFLYAGVSKDDLRVKAAVDWIKRHYTLTENPGMETRGLFYYYHLFAKAMDALGEDTFADAKGVKHDWRQELFTELKRRQKPDGSWVNDNGAFQENVPELATAFAVLALSYCGKK